MTGKRIFVFTGLLILLSHLSGCKTLLINKVIKKYDDRRGTSVSGWSFENKQAEPVLLDTIAGNAFYLHFWGTWCAACLKGLPSHEALFEKLKDRKDIVFLNICVDDEGNREKWKQMVAEKKIGGVNLFTTFKDSTFQSMHLGTEGFPYFMVVGKDQNVLGTGIYPDEDALTLYALVMAADSNMTTKEAVKNLIRLSGKMKKKDTPETLAFAAFLEKYYANNQSTTKP